MAVVYVGKVLSHMLKMVQVTASSTWTAFGAGTDIHRGQEVPQRQSRRRAGYCEDVRI